MSDKARLSDIECRRQVGRFRRHAVAISAAVGYHFGNDSRRARPLRTAETPRLGAPERVVSRPFRGRGALFSRREDEAALRDAVALARPGQDLGPAGRVYAAFRVLAGPGDPCRPKRLAAVAAELQSPLDLERAAELAAALTEAGGRGRPAPIAAAAAAE